MAWNKKQFYEKNNNLEKAIKAKLLASPAVVKLFKQFNVSTARLDNLRIFADNLDGKYAETDGDSMKINENLFKDGWDEFVKKYFFIIAHEIVHWLSRTKEEDGYFNDPEEVLGFVASIAFEMSEGTDLNEIWNKVFPKCEWHFHNPEDAKAFFEKMLIKARKLVEDNRTE